MSAKPELTLGIRLTPLAYTKMAYVLIQGFSGSWAGFEFQNTFMYPQGLTSFLTKAYASTDVAAMIACLPQQEGLLLMLDERQAFDLGLSRTPSVESTTTINRH